MDVLIDASLLIVAERRRIDPAERVTGRERDAFFLSVITASEHEATGVNALLSKYAGPAYHGRRAQTPGFHVQIERALGTEVGCVEVVASEIGRVVLNL